MTNLIRQKVKEIMDNPPTFDDVFPHVNYTRRLEQQNASLVEALDVFFKVIVVDGEQYRPGYPLCEGCDELTIARGWECFYKPHTTECKYPDGVVKG